MGSAPGDIITIGSLLGLAIIIFGGGIAALAMAPLWIPLSLTGGVIWLGLKFWESSR